MARFLSITALVLLASACNGGRRGGGPGVDSGSGSDGATPDGGGGDGSTPMDGSDCTCGVDGSSVRITCGDTQCVGDSQYVCSTGDVRGLLIRTGPCMDSGTPPDMGGSGACSAACSACGTAACDQCNGLASTADTTGCSATYGPFAECLGGSCGDVTPCLSSFMTFAACACPGVSPLLYEEASSCDVSLTLTCADPYNQLETVLCNEAFREMGCAAFGTTACGGG